MLALPASPQMDPARLSAFETVMGGTPRIWIGGITAYGISTFLNVTIFSRLKSREGSGLLWLRAGIASVLSQIVDTLIFITVAFYGVFPMASCCSARCLRKSSFQRSLCRRWSMPSSVLGAGSTPLTHIRAWQICNGC